MCKVSCEITTHFQSHLVSSHFTKQQSTFDHPSVEIPCNISWQIPYSYFRTIDPSGKNMTSHKAKRQLMTSLSPTSFTQSLCTPSNSQCLAGLAQLCAEQNQTPSLQLVHQNQGPSQQLRQRRRALLSKAQQRLHPAHRPQHQTRYLLHLYEPCATVINHNYQQRILQLGMGSHRQYKKS